MLSPHEREARFQNPGIPYLLNPESGKILLEKSGILVFGIQNTAQGIHHSTIKDGNLESKFHLLTKAGIQYLESGFRSVESRICLGFPYIGRLQLRNYPNKLSPKRVLHS